MNDRGRRESAREKVGEAHSAPSKALDALDGIGEDLRTGLGYDGDAMGDGPTRDTTPGDPKFAPAGLPGTCLQADADPDDPYGRWDLPDEYSGVPIGRAAAEGSPEGDDVRLDHVEFHWEEERP